jgi:hypothetical protein
MLIEPVRCTFLEGPSVAPFGVVEIYFLKASEFPVRIKVYPVSIAITRVAAIAAPDERTAAVPDAGIIEDLAVVVDERAIQQFVR